jgi:hypothetical protein
METGKTPARQRLVPMSMAFLSSALDTGKATTSPTVLPICDHDDAWFNYLGPPQGMPMTPANLSD